MHCSLNTPGVYGCVFANHNGLSLGSKYFLMFFSLILRLFFLVKGQVSSNSAGIISAIAEEAAKLEPNSKPPIIHFESDTRSCTIQKGSNVTGAIFKNVQT